MSEIVLHNSERSSIYVDRYLHPEFRLDPRTLTISARSAWSTSNNESPIHICVRTMREGVCVGAS